VPVSSPKIYLFYLFRLGRLLVYYIIMLFRFLRRDRSVKKAIDQEQQVSTVSDWMFS
jgi:hypothetical protein